MSDYDIRQEDDLRELLAECDSYGEAAEKADAVRNDVTRWANRYGIRIDTASQPPRKTDEESDEGNGSDGLEECSHCGSEYKDVERHQRMSDCGEDSV